MPSKYGDHKQRQQEEMREARERVHPIWRGVGMLLIILAPILGYFGSLVLLEENTKQGWFVIPTDFLASSGDPLLYVKIGLTLFLAFILFFVFQLFGTIMLRFLGPPRYGPYDVPAVSYKGKKRSR